MQKYAWKYVSNICSTHKDKKLHFKNNNPEVLEIINT